MSDREKVEKALDCRANDFKLDCRDCSYYIREDTPAYCNFRQILRDALALLKEQEAVVHCKDCKNADYGTDEYGNRFMKCIGSVKCYGGTTPDFFCADGERQEGR